MQAAITAIEHYLPETELSNAQLAVEFPDWSAEKIAEKTGIRTRHLAADSEHASDLAFRAVQRLFASGACSPEDIDFLLLCTQSPDCILPTTACLLQHRLGLPTSVGALDFNLGCSGYLYGLSLAKGLIETGQARNILLVTAETYSKLLHPKDRSSRTLFGDAAAATLIQPEKTELLGGRLVGPFVFGTDGSGAENLWVPGRGMGLRAESSNCNDRSYLEMNGAEIFAFTARVVPEAIATLMARASRTMEEIDLFVFHQANGYLLEHLRKKLEIPHEKYHLALAECGNTVSSTIPIALQDALDAGKLKPGNLVMLVGFGVGYSWGATLVQW